jgi:hypothetical protein
MLYVYCESSIGAQRATLLDKHNKQHATESTPRKKQLITTKLQRNSLLSLHPNIQHFISPKQGN